MERAAAKARIEALRAYLAELNEAYYNLDAPLLEDAEYDRLMQELRALESEFPDLRTSDSPSVKVGGEARLQGKTVEHRVPMLSLQDVFEKEAVLRFLAQVREVEPEASFVVEEKIDGLSLSVRYAQGQMYLAETRGDGLRFGEDVTANARYIVDLPASYPAALADLEVRAEVYLPYAAFEAANAKLAAEERPLFANPRNAAAGTLRQLNPALVAERGLACFVFNLQLVQGRDFTKHSEVLTWLGQQGFPVSPNFVVAQSDEQVWAAIEAIRARREALPYGIDGAVVKVDSLALRERLGVASKYPKWAVAYKYPPEAKSSRLQAIEVQVGRTGRLTPLAILDPIQLAGTTVSRATLHNQAYISALDIRVGDLVRVHKSGDIIPAVLGVDFSARPATSEPYHLPEHCPVCGAPTEYRDGADLYCSNPLCPAQRQRALEYFCSKAAMDIDGLGPSKVEALLHEGYLQSIADLYRLHEQREQLVMSGLIGRAKTVDKLLAAIEGSKAHPWPRILAALGIPLVGPLVAQTLARAYPDFQALSAATELELMAIDGIGPEIAASLRSFMERPENQALLAELQELGLNFAPLERQASSAAGPLQGEVLVLTGRLSGMNRSEAQQRIEAAGGEFRSQLTQQCTALVQGEGGGSKLAKARELGVPIWSEEDLLRKLEG